MCALCVCVYIYVMYTVCMLYVYTHTYVCPSGLSGKDTQATKEKEKHEYVTQLTERFPSM